MRLLACLIVAPQRGYDEPAILSYAISSFCPTSADGLHLMGDSHVRLEPGRRIHHGAWMASNPFPGSSRPACQSQLTFSCFASPPDTSMTGAPWATQFLGPLPLLFFAVVVVSSASFTPLITRMHPIVLLPPALPQTVNHTSSGPDSLATVARIVPLVPSMITDDLVVDPFCPLQPIRMSLSGPTAMPCGVSHLTNGRSKTFTTVRLCGLITATTP